VYTYTTIISQCGSHQQLRKALELVAEMRGRGIMCNVHTYSALMNVCIKASRCLCQCDPG
jgi:pentatricopeptide repeat domain-containing protein 1